MVIGIIADAMEIDRDDLKRRRAESVHNVKATNGLISLEKRARAAEEPNWMVTNGKTDPEKPLYQEHRRRGGLPALHRNAGAGGDPSG